MAPVITPTQTDLKSFTYEQLMFWAQIKANGNFEKYAAEAARFGVGEEQAMLDFLQGTGNGFGINAQKMADGSYSGYMFNNPVDLPVSNPLDSNAGTISRATFREMVGQKFQDVQGVLKRHITRFPASGGLGDKASYVVGSIAAPVAAVSFGTKLGKAIDSTLYSLNPDFWDGIGFGSLNPETWSTLTNGDDSPFAGLLNMILGIDPDTGTAQMYMNQDALAYMAYAMNQAGVFAPLVETYMTAPESSEFDSLRNSNMLPFITQNVWTIVSDYYGSTRQTTYTTENCNMVVYIWPISASSNIFYKTFIYFTTDSNAVSTADVKVDIYDNGVYVKTSRFDAIGTQTSFTYDGKTVYYRTYNEGGGRSTMSYTPTNSLPYPRPWPIPNTGQIAWVASYGTPTESGGIEGIGNQSGATLPDTSTWDTPENTLASLQQQYPEMFDNAMVWDNDSDDGTPSQTTWVPVPMPTATSATDTQPTTGTQTQTSIDISDLSEVLQKVITDIVQETQTKTDEQPLIPPQNPVDVGTGEPPILVPPSGNASALWSVYHPTQAQINQFGGWLWTDSIIEQFIRLMNNPMEGIITLHRVFVMPVDNGTGTIVVGRLDSQVSSATVTQQYVYADCGTVSLNEQFANVFDYQPFTTVSLYLPFIGIVPLDVGDIMRSSIHIKYGVDVFTGACLAMVEVIRDGNTVNMYQYTGVASVSYPLTGAQNSGLLSGLLGMAAGIGSIATGNVAGVGMVASGAVNAAHVNMGRSGGFSGNAGAMGIKKPYLIISRPQTMVAQTFPNQLGYPTNYSATLGSYSGFVQCRAMHVESTCATQAEISEIQSLLSTGVMV